MPRTFTAPAERKALLEKVKQAKLNLEIAKGVLALRVRDLQKGEEELNRQAGGSSGTDGHEFARMLLNTAKERHEEALRKLDDANEQLKTAEAELAASKEKDSNRVPAARLEWRPKCTFPSSAGATAVRIAGASPAITTDLEASKRILLDIKHDPRAEAKGSVKRCYSCSKASFKDRPSDVQITVDVDGYDLKLHDKKNQSLAGAKIGNPVLMQGTVNEQDEDPEEGQGSKPTAKGRVSSGGQIWEGAKTLLASSEEEASVGIELGEEELRELRQFQEDFGGEEGCQPLECGCSLSNTLVSFWFWKRSQHLQDGFAMKPLTAAQAHFVSWALYRYCFIDLETLFSSTPQEFRDRLDATFEKVDNQEARFRFHPHNMVTVPSRPRGGRDSGNADEDG